MTKKVCTLVLLAVMITVCLASSITVYVFDTPFAHSTIDYFSFAAALFLIIDGVYKITRYRNEPYVPNNMIRHIRIIIGTCVFTIHILQYIYGI
ncbi:MAG: hypothetical protein JW994_01735 [Candidatus Omnitrophica bacterium]|nr:hypothetical protein [Candidatus Omnitrophota bacterium]